MISCIRNIVFNILRSPFDLAEFIEYLILNLLPFHLQSHPNLQSIKLLLNFEQPKVKLYN